MVACVVLLIILVLFALVAFLKVGLQLSYIDKAFQLNFKIGFLKLSLGKKDNKKEKEIKSFDGEKKPKQKKAIWPTIQTVLSHWSEILSLIGRVLTSPTIDDLYVNIAVGGDDPASAAVTYGRICAVAGGLLSGLESTFKISKRQINAQCRFDQSETDIDVRLSISLRIHEIIALAIAALQLGLGIYRELNNNKKAVQKV